jgi:DNA-binding NtrC family response regulator
MAVDVRLIAATHQDLEQLIRQGRFREDLFYRLNVISISVPALRERRDDIPELALHFLKLYAQRCGKPTPQVDDDALAAFKCHSWPGNIRELENVIERAVVVAEGTLITLSDLPPELVRSVDGKVNGDWPEEIQPESEAQQHRGRKERERLVRALAAARGNKAEAARALGVARSTLVSRLKKHGLS